MFGRGYGDVSKLFPRRPRLAYKELGDAIAYVNAHARPLALYISAITAAPSDMSLTALIAFESVPSQPPQPRPQPVPSHPSCPWPAVRADARRGHQREQSGMGWADVVGGKGRLIFLYPSSTRLCSTSPYRRTPEIKPRDLLSF
jgi:hypothetical protein